MAVLVWFHHELRTHDNPLMQQAATHTGPIYAVYCDTPSQWQKQHHSPARCSYQLQRLIALRAELAEHNIPLIVLEGCDYASSIALVLEQCDTLKVDTLLAGAEYGLWERQRDEKLRQAIANTTLDFRLVTTQTLLAPGTLRTGSGQFYRVFTPFSKAWLNRLPELPPPSAKSAQNSSMPSCDLGLSDAQLAKRAKIAIDIPVAESQVLEQLRQFIEQRSDAYQATRDFPAQTGTSRLSTALAHGVISTRQAVALLQPHEQTDGAKCWLNELIWREFYIHLLAEFDSISYGIAFKEQTRNIHWDDNREAELAWQRGETGIPIVDAGMRQLNQTGWMHNRVRMLTAAFFCKNLWLDWRRGERYFMSHLIDGHLASNNGGWQWSASTGTDAAPYFRVFNPETQSRKFDPEGQYLRRYLPELHDLDAKSIHNPTLAQRRARHYPEAIVELKASRARAIELFAAQTK